MRPQGFKNPHEDKPFSFEECKLQEAFEAGADAMLEAKSSCFLVRIIVIASNLYN